MSALLWLIERFSVLGSRALSNFRLLLGREGFYITLVAPKVGLGMRIYLE